MRPPALPRRAVSRFLPDYILDHMEVSLVTLLAKMVVLVWPEGWPGLPSEPAAGAAGSGGGGDPPASGPALLAQLSFPNRSLRQAFVHLFAALSHPMHDPRLVDVLRGARLPDVAADAEAAAELHGGAVPVPPESHLSYNMALPYRLVRVVSEGRADNIEVKVALEMLDEMFLADEAAGAYGAAAAAGGNGPAGRAGQGPGVRQLGLVEDALEAGLLRAMSDLRVFSALTTEAGCQGLTAYVRWAAAHCPQPLGRRPQGGLGGFALPCEAARYTRALKQGSRDQATRSYVGPAASRHGHSQP